ncbi:hypothetical protein Tco_1577483 [Tanacetum coccineum]
MSEHLYSASAIEIDKKKPELKEMPSHLKYAYLNGDESFLVIISSKLTGKEKTSLLWVLEKRKRAIAWKMSNIKGISPSFCTHKILMEESFKPVIQPQRRLNPKVQVVVKDEIVRLLDSGLIYPISDKVMKFESAHSNTTAKLPILKLGEYEMMGDKNQAILPGTRLCSMGGHREWIEACYSLALPTEHQLTFIQYTDAKTMLCLAIETRFRDLEQVHEDDLEAMDLKWQLSLLSMRAKGHFDRECRAPRNKEGQFINQDNTRKHGNNEDTSSKAMLAIDGVGFD